MFRIGFDPAEMIVDLGDAGNILGCDNRRLPCPLVENDAAEMNEAVAYGDAERNGSPFFFSIAAKTRLRIWSSSAVGSGTSRARSATA
jgi:hypothetical protein